MFLIIVERINSIVSFVVVMMVMMMRSFSLVIGAEGEGVAERVAKGVDEGVEKNHGKAIRLSLIALLRPPCPLQPLRPRQIV